MTRKNIVYKTRRLACYIQGNGDTSLFFVHGNSCSSRSYDLQFRSNLSRDFRLAAVDLPGHGNSEPAAAPETGYSFPELGNAVSAAAAALKLNNIIYIGHSLGGHILLQNADKLPRLKGVIIAGASPFSLPPRFDLAFLDNPASAAFFRADNKSELIRSWAAAMVAPDIEPAEFMLKDISRTDPVFRERIGRHIAEGDLRDELKMLSKLWPPAAVLHGTHDQIISSVYMEVLSAKRFWNGGVQFLDCGHSPHWELPSRFNSLIRSYSASLRDVY